MVKLHQNTIATKLIFLGLYERIKTLSYNFVGWRQPLISLTFDPLMDGWLDGIDRDTKSKTEKIHWCSIVLNPPIYIRLSVIPLPHLQVALNSNNEVNTFFKTFNQNSYIKNENLIKILQYLKETAITKHYPRWRSWINTNIMYAYKIN